MLRHIPPTIQMHMDQMRRTSTLLTNIFTLAGYCVLGLSTEFLPIPPDFATPVWPAAGFALAMVLLHGPRVLPGVFMGAFVINGLIPPWQGVAIGPAQLSLAALIALGATVQAGV